MIRSMMKSSASIPTSISVSWSARPGTTVSVLYAFGSIFHCTLPLVSSPALVSFWP